MSQDKDPDAAEPRPNPADELAAMQVVAKAMAPLDPAAMERVLYWAAGFYLGTTGVSLKSRQAVSSAAAGTIGVPADDEIGNMEVAEFFGRAGPNTDAGKALVLAYWLRRAKGVEEFDSQSLNAELTHLGHKVGNITRAFTVLMETRPQLVVQTRKQGTTRQARKRYKVTVEGMRRVEGMLRGDSQM